MHSTLEQSELNAKIGRLFMAGIPGTRLDEGTEALIREYCLGGVILFARNIEDPLQLAALCNDLQERAMRYHGTRLFLAIDQEGGRVARLKSPFTGFPGNTAIGRNPRPVDKAIEYARITAQEMTLVGLNMNLAPVVDVPGRKPEKHLEGRTFCNDPDMVARLGRTVIRVLQRNGIMAVAKHFPGLGRTSLDPHHHLPVIEMDAKEIEEINLIPFKAAIAERVSAFMTSHAIYPALDPDKPSTLSEKILTGLLRKALGFQGLLITDDLEMGAIRDKWGVAEGAVASFEAGADILLICEDQNMVLEGIRTLRKKLLQNNVTFQRLDQSLERIRKAKSGFLKNTKEVSLEKVGAYFGL
ncbi:MAG: beta-N-acetylhexosaminidase [Thermodesulfobacteriota bacterium]|nr:beta-N-acetylhexosaminidase [Thermodesulfobacteriota bacterium]